MKQNIQKLAQKEVQDYVAKNLKTDLQRLVLKGSPFPDIAIQALATQISGKKDAEKKLPTWFAAKGVVYPPKLNMEQCSSELTAHYKASLLGGKTLVDLTGGFGVDDYYFSKRFERVTHCELNAELSTVASHNFKVLGAINIQTYEGDGAVFLQRMQRADALYVDPSRRAGSGRVFMLKDCEPNVIENQELYLHKAKQVMIKAAPMLDINLALSDLQNVAEVHVVSVKNECKESLFILRAEPRKEAIKMVCAMLGNTSPGLFSFSPDEEKNAESAFSEVQNYLYEPDAAILKAGAFKLLGERLQINKLQQHSHLYTSSDLVDFPGKRFKVLQTILFNDFKKAQVPKQINVVCRNFDLKPEDLKKRFGLKDGGADFLFFSTDYKNRKVVIHAQKINFT